MPPPECSDGGLEGSAGARAAVPVAHALRIPDDLSVVGGNAELPGQVVGGPGIVNPSACPLAVVRDEDDRGRLHGRGRFDESLDATSGARELLKVLHVGTDG